MGKFARIVEKVEQLRASEEAPIADDQLDDTSVLEINLETISNKSYARRFSDVGNLLRLLILISTNKNSGPIDAEKVTQLINIYNNILPLGTKTIRLLLSTPTEIENTTKKRYILKIINLLRVKLTPKKKNVIIQKLKTIPANISTELTKLAKRMIRMRNSGNSKDNTLGITTADTRLFAYNKNKFNSQEQNQPDEPTDNITGAPQSVAAIDGPSAVTTDTGMTQSDAPKSLKEKIKTAPTEKLREQANKIFPVLEQVDALKDHDEIKTISGILETNTSWDTFRFVAPEGASVNDDAAASINKSIETFYAKVSQEYDRSTANFVTRLASDALQNAALIGDGAYLTQHAANTKIDLAKTADGSGVTLSVDLGPEFFMVRTYSNDKTTVNNDRLRIPTIAQGSGVNKKIFHDALKVYEARGVEKITLVANVDVGGYAWFRYGFVPRDLKQVEKIYNWIVRITGKIDIAFKYDDATICKHLFGDELSNTDQPYRINLVKSTLNSIANQFKAKYYNEKEWKKMNETIISDGTNVKINNDMTTKVTFGQVLKLQTLDGGQVFTMLPGEYLEWDGVLDMTDHERMKTAYAYLNLTDKKKSGKK